jgi:hypothetical protein
VSILTLLLIYLLLFSLIGMVLLSSNLLITYITRFIDTPETDKYFVNFEETFFNLFVLMTTTNFPDIMLPAYKNNRWSFFFFFFFLVGATILFTNMIIANFFYVYQN